MERLQASSLICGKRDASCCAGAKSTWPRVVPRQRATQKRQNPQSPSKRSSGRSGSLSAAVRSSLGVIHFTVAHLLAVMLLHSVARAIWNAAGSHHKLSTIPSVDLTFLAEADRFRTEHIRPCQRPIEKNDQVLRASDGGGRDQQGLVALFSCLGSNLSRCDYVATSQ